MRCLWLDDALSLFTMVRELGNPRVAYIFLVGIPKVEDGLAVWKRAGVVVVRSNYSIPEVIGNPEVAMFIVKVMEQVESLDAP